ncbi:Y-family DNA polymerase [Devosia sp. CN2-171]|uniref:Y-family DNA polymerase n=1 Tax=Devosia sp. CN2-171 TaxID=3400909 RepID=UPI003BF7F9E2
MASYLSSPGSDRQLGLIAPRRFLALSLPLWATDCLKRADPSLGTSRRPLALWEKQQGAMRLAAIDAAASRAGLSVGQNLSDARALVPELELREIDHSFITHVFADFADWHSNASPIVAVLPNIAPFGDLVMDITGVDHLFGGEEKMLAQLLGRLRVLGYTVIGAIADTIGAAWAAAHFSPGILPSGTLEDALAHLPVGALRLDEAQISGLNQMGLKTIGQLYSRDRRALQARFGSSLLIRLDQALGRIEERLVPRLPIAEYHTERRFAEPIGYMDDVLMTTHDLATRLALRLETEQLGAQTFHLLLYRVDHKVMTLSVNAARATRDANHIAQLFVHRSERLEGEYDAGFGIDMIRLAASSLSDVSSTQIGAFETEDGAEDLNRLFDRMTSRLGPLSVLRSKYQNTHIPERAVVLEPIVARTADDPAAAPNTELRRPIRLLPAPEPIEVIAEVPHGPPMRMVWRRVSYRVLKASGPERIEAEWWRTGQNLAFLLPPPDPDKPEAPPPDKTKKKVIAPRLDEHVSKLETFSAETTVRDYYVIEDDGGRRFWVFRIGLYGAKAPPRWYLHGFFA